MDKEFFFRPDYVEKFQCDGQKCNSLCCKGWNIDIDEETYKNYSRLQPDAAAKDITSKIIFSEERNSKIVVMNEKNFCPFLTEDKLCIIQKTYGEKFLSVTCRTYPRNPVKIGNILEMSLCLTCPVAARLILLREEPIAFEKSDVIPDFGRIMTCKVTASENFSGLIVETQKAAISILQERKLTVDERLAVLGFFLDKLDELINAWRASEISNLAEFYTSEKFISEQVPEILSGIKFNPEEFIRFMRDNVLEILYDKKLKYHGTKNLFLDAVEDVLKIKSGNSISEVTEKYLSLNGERKKFVRYFAGIFENYLVNEFFYNLYPFRLRGSSSIRKNFAVFVVNYKIIELFTFCVMMSMFKNVPGKNSFLTEDNKTNVVLMISNLTNSIDHNTEYDGTIETFFDDEEDTLKIISTFLQTERENLF